MILRRPTFTFGTLLLLLLHLRLTRSAISNAPCPPDAKSLRQTTRSLFNHAFNAYKLHAFPHDELRPLTCSGTNTFGNLTVSLIDTLDTLAILDQWDDFTWAVNYISHNVSFDQDQTVSVFETTIRVLGGLLSAHQILLDPTIHSLPESSYNDKLLHMAVDLADRLLPAFETKTGIPFGAIHLRHGVAKNESIIASTAGAGSLLLEFGTLTRYTNNPIYYNKAFTAMQALHRRAASTGLVGNHIDVHTGHWVATDSGVGGLVDSFYEYLFKGWILFGDDRLLPMFANSYKAVKTYVHKAPWYLDVDMYSGNTVALGHSSLSAFWPGVQVLLGKRDLAAQTTRAHFGVWKRYGCIPEAYHVQMHMPIVGQVNYPLRPELVESVFYLHWATNDSAWLGVGASVLHSLESVMKVECGIAEVKDVSNHELSDLMPSFVMSETLKYLFLLFSGSDEERGHWVRKLRSGRYVFSTEAHPFLIPDSDIHEIIGGGKAGSGRMIKCARDSDVESFLPCGYGVKGKDYELFDIRSVMPEMIDKDVSREVDRRVESADTPRVGEIFIGARNGYRVTNIAGEHVYFEKIGERERNAEIVRREAVKRRGRWCRQRLFADSLTRNNVCFAVGE